jgi:RHS repeat-associated protein
MTRYQAASVDWKYLYDASGERTVKIPSAGTTYFFTLRDPSNRVVTEYQGSAVSRDNIYLGSLLVATYANCAINGAPGWQYYSSDHLGTPRLVTDAYGNTLDMRKYWPFGAEALSSGSTQRVRFAGMERDDEANRYYDHARSHDVGLARFLSVDPLVGSPSNPQTWNRYSYSRNNPLKYTDPDGREVVLAEDSDPDARNLLINEISQAIGLKVSEGEDGALEREAGPPTSDHASAMAAFDDAASPSTPRIKITATRESAYLIGDRFENATQANPQLNPFQLASFPARPFANSPEGTTRGELLTHILAEYAAAANAGEFSPTTFHASHSAGIAAQNQYRLGIGQQSQFTPAGSSLGFDSSGNGSMKIMYTTGHWTMVRTTPDGFLNVEFR